MSVNCYLIDRGEGYANHPPPLKKYDESFLLLRVPSDISADISCPEEPQPLSSNSPN